MATVRHLRTGDPLVARVLRTLAVAVTGALVVALAGAPMRPTARIDLYQDGVHVDGTGLLHELPAGTAAVYHPGSRVLATADDEASLAVAAEHRAWLAAGETCGTGSDAEAVAQALLDIHALVGAQIEGREPHAPGAVVAGWEDRWRYVWPRDAAFVAVALARTGHWTDAVEILAFLADATAEHGDTFAARYLPTGDGVPDARADQLDGAGWMLWAAASVLADDATDDRVALDDARRHLRPLLDRATGTLLAATADDGHLPPPSSDYWERVETDLTLGTAAVALAGLEAARELAPVIGTRDATAAGVRADLVREAVVDRFGPDFRRSGGSAFTDGRDAATAFLLPPIGSGTEGAEDAWLASVADMSRVSGGVAPGATWRHDGISWTPETTLYALTAASAGEEELARELIDWTLEHRTASGAIPEKVLADGSPAAVAPLAWSAANLVLAVCALDDHP
ncbi:glycoside hydrolase family 15 [Salana multivorans]|uniref:glycoside hydrolase family 15 n=1 Tax=Salana multivorans TaxID=120377 RepID=UPI002490345F|nr:glycoside hydrolase family 15 [Salana multivorans]